MGGYRGSAGARAGTEAPTAVARLIDVKTGAAPGVTAADADVGIAGDDVGESCAAGAGDPVQGLLAIGGEVHMRIASVMIADTEDGRVSLKQRVHRVDRRAVGDCGYSGTQELEQRGHIRRRGDQVLGEHLGLAHPVAVDQLNRQPDHVANVVDVTHLTTYMENRNSSHHDV